MTVLAEFPPVADRSTVVVDGRTARDLSELDETEFPYIVWCGECHRIVNAYEDADDAESAARAHAESTTYHHRDEES